MLTILPLKPSKIWRTPLRKMMKIEDWCQLKTTFMQGYIFPKFYSVCRCGILFAIDAQELERSCQRSTKQMRNISALSTGTDKLNVIIQRSKRRMLQPVLAPHSSHILFPKAPNPHMLASVIVPVKDEAEHIGKTLDALRLQFDMSGNPLPHHLYEVLLLANNCTDDTFHTALVYAKQYPEFQLHVANIEIAKPNAHIGTVRRMLMDEAFRRHKENGVDGIILSTDGDTEADGCWIATTLHEMQNGYDAVGGRILTHRVSCDSRLYHLQDTTYRYLSAKLELLIDPPARSIPQQHFQYFGASMAVRCSAYLKAGRLPVLPFLEDEAFSRALSRIDARIRRSPAVKVYTSPRLCGRVPVGLSAHLTHLALMNKSGKIQYVESPEVMIKKWRLKQHLRCCWQLRKDKLKATQCIGKIAADIGVSKKWLLAEMDISVYFGELWEATEKKLYEGPWNKLHKPVPITEAISSLRTCLRDHLRLL